MQQWEYHFEDASALTNMSDMRRPQTLVKFRDLGRQGWELVSLLADKGGVWATFKRPIEEASPGLKGTAASAVPPVGRNIPS